MVLYHNSIVLLASRSHLRQMVCADAGVRYATNMRYLLYAITRCPRYLHNKTVTYLLPIGHAKLVKLSLEKRTVTITMKG